MKQTRTKYGDNATVINALQAQGAWPVASTVQIYETARAHGFGYVGAAEVFMTNKVGRGKWDVSGVSTDAASATPASVLCDLLYYFGAFRRRDCRCLP